MTSEISQRVQDIRNYLISNDLDAFILPTADEHLGEYQPKNALRVTWLSNFHGENCVVVITRDKAGIFVDGRFTVQVKQQVPGDIFDYLHVVNDSHLEWTATHLDNKGRVAIDASLFGINWYKQAESFFQEHSMELVSLPENPVDLYWKDRPAAPSAPIEIFTNSGKSSAEKRADLSTELKAQKLHATLLTQPEDINWLLNLRGADIPYVRTTLSFGLLLQDGSLHAFIDTTRLPKGFTEHAGAMVSVYPMADMQNTLASLISEGQRIHLDPDQTNAGLYNLVKAQGAVVVEGFGPCAAARVCKNQKELSGMKAAHLEDGVAMARFLAWLDREMAVGNAHTEASIARQLLAFRKQGKNFIDSSFGTISALGPNGAICHYVYDEEHSRAFGEDGVLLVDSGGHYNGEDGTCGTTDITRTMKVGKVTEEQRRMFTLVLKGHINLDQARFMPGTTGVQLDMLARQPLWRHGFNFDHGTGHGVGHFISVHEMPPRINPNNNLGALKEGMVVTNEPGYYEENSYGIRLENVLSVRKAEGLDGDRDMLEFENMTFTPFDIRMIRADLLTVEEIEWVNSYHATVYEKISPLLNEEDQAWLRQATNAI